MIATSFSRIRSWRWAVIAVLISISMVSHATTPTWASEFTGKLDLASLRCKLSAQMAEQAEKQSLMLTQPPDPKYAEQYTHTCSQGQYDARDAFHAAMAASPGHADSIKKVYAAWMTYMDSIIPGSDADFSREKAAYTQAVNELRIGLDSQ